jgi:sugar lactone lactonase YvrE
MVAGHGWGRPRASLLLCVFSAFAVAAPLWVHRWLPIQDWPQHLATLRILHEVHFGGPARELHAVDLGHTQYLLFYVVGDLLACVLGVRAAGLVLLTAYLVGTIASLHALLDALGRDPRLALLGVPLLTNSLFLLGLVQFLLGVPLMLLGWSLAIRNLREWSARRAAWLAAVALLAFYAHVVAFGLFVIGLSVLTPYRSARASLRHWLPLVPSAAACLYWGFFTSSGAFVRGALLRDAGERDLWPFATSVRALYSVAFDTYRDASDEVLFAAAALLAAAMTTLGAAPGRRGVVSTARWLIVPLACTVLYFCSEGHHGFLGHIRDRYPLVAVLALVPVLRMPARTMGHVGTALMMILSLATAERLDRSCTRFEEGEAGDFDGALAAIPPGKTVAGLMFWTESVYFNQNPFLQYVAYYVVERGGAATFSFDGFPHWPTAYRPHAGPPDANPAPFLWEWAPSGVAPREELAAAYDYVLVRGSHFDPPDALFVKIWQGGAWSVWQRRPLSPSGGEPRAATTPSNLSPVAGRAGGRGDLDGAGREARLGLVEAMTRVEDALVFADAGNGTVRRFLPSSGAVETLARLPDAPGDRPSIPAGIAYDGTGRVFVSDRAAHVIDSIDLRTRELSMLLGRPGIRGDADGPLGGALLDTPTGLAFGGDHTLYVVDHGNRSVRRVDLARGLVTTLARGFLGPWGICYRGGAVLVTDMLNESLLRIDAATAEVRLLAGANAFGHRGATDGSLGTGRLSGPRGVTCGEDAIFVADHANERLRRLDPSTLSLATVQAAGSEGIDSVLAWDAETVYVGGAATLRVLAPDGKVTTVAGSPDEARTDALAGPTAVAYVLEERAAYVASCEGASVVRVDLDRGVSATFAGGAHLDGFADASGEDARFSCLSAVAFDGKGTLYVADRGNHAVRAVDLATRRVRTVAGGPWTCGATDGPLALASFCDPTAIVFHDAALFVADRMTSTVRRIDLARGTVSTLARLDRPVALTWLAGALVAALEDGTLRRVDPRTGEAAPVEGARFDRPRALAASGADGLLVVDGRAVYDVTLAPLRVTALLGQHGGVRWGAESPSLSVATGVAEIAAGDALVVDHQENVLARLRY